MTALLQMLDDPRNDIYLHMDAKNVAFKDTDLPSLGNASLHQIHRISVSWGGYSLVRCEMMLFEAACSNGPYAYYHLISGQDLPIKTQDQIHSFFSRNAGKEFVRFQSEEFCFQDRVRYFHFFHERCGRGDRKSFWTFAESVSLALQRVLGVRRNPDIRFQKGTQWVSVTDDSYVNLSKTENGSSRYSEIPLVLMRYTSRPLQSISASRTGCIILSSTMIPLQWYA